MTGILTSALDTMRATKLAKLASERRAERPRSFDDDEAVGREKA